MAPAHDGQASSSQEGESQVTSVGDTYVDLVVLVTAFSVEGLIRENRHNALSLFSKPEPCHGAGPGQKNSGGGRELRLPLRAASTRRGERRWSLKVYLDGDLGASFLRPFQRRERLHVGVSCRQATHGHSENHHGEESGAAGHIRRAGAMKV